MRAEVRFEAGAEIWDWQMDVLYKIKDQWILNVDGHSLWRTDNPLAEGALVMAANWINRLQPEFLWVVMDGERIQALFFRELDAQNYITARPYDDYTIRTWPHKEENNES